MMQPPTQRNSVKSRSLRMLLAASFNPRRRDEMSRRSVRHSLETPAYCALQLLLVRSPSAQPQTQTDRSPRAPAKPLPNPSPGVAQVVRHFAHREGLGGFAAGSPAATLSHQQVLNEVLVYFSTGEPGPDGTATGTSGAATSDPVQLLGRPQYNLPPRRDLDWRSISRSTCQPGEWINSAPPHLEQDARGPAVDARDARYVATRPTPPTSDRTRTCCSASTCHGLPARCR